jgi:hypothetical protein
MAHKSSWLIDKRVMLLEYDGNVDKNEIGQLNEELNRFLDEGNKPVHIISDNSNMGKADLSIQLAREAFTAMKRPGWGWVIFVGLDRLIRFFAEVFATQFGIKIKIAANREEALIILKKLDLTLEEQPES